MISRKEFMRKYVAIILFSFLSFFLFGFKVSALDVDINFDNHDHFNFFYEMKEDTPFYRFLIGQGNNLSNTLYEYFSPGDGTDIVFPFISIYYYSDLESFYTVNNAYYVIRSTSGHSSCSSSSVYLYFNDSSQSFRVNYSCSGNYSPYSVLYYFDQYGNYITHKNLGASNYNNYYDFSYYSFDNFEYFLSLVYYYDGVIINSSSNSNLKIRVKNIITDNETYILSSDNWLSNIWHSIVSLFTGAKYMSDSGLGLEYFRRDYVITESKGFPGLIKVLSGVDNEVSVPGNYQSKSFSMTDELHLYPLTSCSLEDVALYVRANSSDKFSLYLNEVNSNDELSYQSSYYSNYVPKSNKFIKINPLKVYSTEGTLTNLDISLFTNYVYRLSRFDNFNTYSVYYNPNCYSSVYVEESLEWTNPNTGNTIIVSPDYNNWSDPENVNSGNSVNFIDNNLNAENLIQKGWSGAGSFVEAANTIVSLSFSLFNDMPAEMQALLFTFFAIGLVLILLKIFL